MRITTLLFENFYEEKAVIRWYRTIRTRFGHADEKSADQMRVSHAIAPMRRSFRPGRRKGFTLVEVVICLLIVLFAGMATIGSITYTRLNLELEKQRLAALNYCSQAMEAIQSLDTAKEGTKLLVPFNSPGIEDLDATLKVEYYDINDDGTVNWASSREEPAIGRPVFARVTVNWTPYGTMARDQEVAMSTVVTRGID